MTLRDEIREQPEVVARFLAEQAGNIESIAASLRDLTAVGTSSSPRAAQPTTPRATRSTCRRPPRVDVALAVPSTVDLRRAAGLARALAIGISQSGPSPDIVSLIAEARAQGGPTLAITNEPDSPLAAAADLTIALSPARNGGRGDQDVHRPAARARDVVGRPQRRSATAPPRRHPRHGRAAPHREPDIERIALDQAAANPVARHRPRVQLRTALEIALKMRSCPRFADPYSVADLLHGPLTRSSLGVPVLAVVRAGGARGSIWSRSSDACGMSSAGR